MRIARQFGFCRAHRAHRAQRIVHGRGQALPLGLVFLLACLAAMFFMFNSGQAVDEKLNVINAADAAAYSAGVMQARTLNYEAYLNRAIIANELAIAQAISMVSWTQYFQSAVSDVWAIDAFIAGTGLALGRDGARAALLASALVGTAYANAEAGGAVLAQSVNYVKQANQLIV